MCIILYTKINGKIILAKNRDRTYKPSIEIIHEIIDDIEIVYIKDKETCWIEGMNSFGFGIINATLDTNDNKDITKSFKLKQQKSKYKRNKIFQTLSQNKKSKILYTLFKQPVTNNSIIEGNTLFHLDNQIYHTENTINKNLTMKILKRPHVYSNHSNYSDNVGYKMGKKGVSSYLRQKLVETQLKLLEPQLQKKGNLKIYELLLDNVMNINYKNIDPRFHSYRDKKILIKKFPEFKNNTIISTTGQLLLNLTDKEFVYYYDKNNSNKITYINKLPKHYTPIIKVIIKETEKNLKPK